MWKNISPAPWCEDSFCQISKSEHKRARVARVHVEFVLLETQQHEGWFLWRVVFHPSGDCIFSNVVISFRSNQNIRMMAWLNIVLWVPKENGMFHFFVLWMACCCVSPCTLLLCHGLSCVVWYMSICPTRCGDKKGTPPRRNMRKRLFLGCCQIVSTCRPICMFNVFGYWLGWPFTLQCKQKQWNCIGHLWKNMKWFLICSSCFITFLPANLSLLDGSRSFLVPWSNCRAFHLLFVFYINDSVLKLETWIVHLSWFMRRTDELLDTNHWPKQSGFSMNPWFS